MKNTQRVGKRAFTLIELLVVIAIIAILAAILFPVFARARENARRASCMSNLKQITLGSTMYRQDYDGRFPSYAWVTSAGAPTIDTNTSMPSGLFKAQVGHGSGAASGHNVTWMDMLYPYIKSTQIFVCPSATSDKTAPSYGRNSAFSGYGADRTKYNEYYFARGIYDDYTITDAEVERPSEVVLFIDYNTIYSVRATPKNMNNSTTYPTVVSPHLDGQNRAYVDGHVKWQPLAKLIHLSSETSSHCNNTTTTVATYEKGVSDTYCDPSFNPWMN